MKPILEIRNVSKKYQISSRQLPYLSLRESLLNIFRAKEKTSDFWALDDVSFEVMPGDTVGIMGRNGAGKSTLLKILSRITPPTRGNIITRGRSASLLEVGTGFHPELSGRENIFLNGSILGMKREEIRSRFDAILDFAGVEQFVDTPLKNYSSGMQLRLAFSVAAFLNPEILIIDEVLAVGDIEFQKKCLGKMEDVSRSGRTILFVSHDLTAISSLTKKAAYLQGGKLQAFGPTPQIVEQYLGEGLRKTPSFRKDYDGKGRPGITRVELFSSFPDNVHVHGDPFRMEIDITAPEVPAIDTWMSVHITDSKGRGVLHITKGGKEKELIPCAGTSTVSISFPSLKLYMGTYLISVYLAGPPNGPVYERLREIMNFEVIMHNSSNEYGWQKDVCVYLEENTWQVSTLKMGTR